MSLFLCEVEIPKDSLYCGESGSTLIPFYWGRLLGLKESEVEMEALFFTDQKYKMGEKVLLIPQGYYKVRDEVGLTPYFIFMGEDFYSKSKLTKEFLEAHTLKIEKFVRKHFEIISVGNSKAAQEIVKSCKMNT